MDTSINSEKATQEVVENLVNLVRFDTTNPPGNELPAILHIKSLLENAGFPPEQIQVLESQPGRANLVARLKGDGSARPFLFSGHVDVVPVERERWTHDPFAGDIADGCVWGRGTLDMKGFTLMYLQIFLEALRQKMPLKRDLIFAAIADEENGMRHGSGFLSEQHKDLIDAEFGLTEGGAMTVHFGKTRIYPIQVAEKSVCWMRMTTSGQPGHGSMPHSDNAVFHLGTALGRLEKAGHLPVHITPTWQSMMQSVGAQSKLPVRLLTRLLQKGGVVNFLLGRIKGEGRVFMGALTTNTVSATILRAGNKANVIPSTAEAQLDCRLLPGQNPEDAMREIKAITGVEAEFELLYTTQGPEVSTETPLYKLLEKATKRMDPGGIVIPMMMPGATDANQYQKAGIKVYGFTPGVLPKEIPVLKMAHGHDERIPISYIQSGLPVLWEVIQGFC